MGSLWSDVSQEKLERAELGLFEAAGLFPSLDIQIRNVPIFESQNNSENYIHEVKVHSTGKDLPKLLMIHGYGGGGAVFYKMIRHLRNYFQVYTIDLLGQGMSGRPDYEIKHDFDATVDYFTESIRAWILKSDLAEANFTLLGHSMGGLFAGWYALKHPEGIERLVFMSSVGISRSPDWAKVDNLLTTVKDSYLATKGARWFVETMKEQWSPFDVYRAQGSPLSHRAIKNGINRRISPGILSAEEVEHMTNYVYQMMVRKKSSELLVSKIVLPFAQTPKALEDRLAELQGVPMAFMYGEFDWVNRDVGDRLIKGGAVTGEVFQTAQSSHHLYLEAADECVACLIKFVYGEERAKAFIEGLVLQTQDSSFRS